MRSLKFILAVLLFLTIIGLQPSRALGASPIPHDWQTISATQYYHHAGGFAINNGIVYAIGGHDCVNITTQVEYAPVYSNGTLGTWTATSSLVNPSYTTAAVVALGHLYLVGGRAVLPPVWSNVVQVADINPDGSLSAWRTTSPMILDRDNLGAVNIGNYIYAIGGSPEWNDQSSVEYAEILSNGDLGAWQYTTSMNQIRKSVFAVAYEGCIYAIGGGTGDLSDSTNTVEKACANPDGTLGTWEYQASLNFRRSETTGVVAQDKLFVIGGWDGTSILDSVEVADINPDGSLEEWKVAEPLLHKWMGGDAVATDSFVYILDGTIDYYPNLTKNVDRAYLIQVIFMPLLR